MTYTDDNAQARADFIASLGLSLSALFVPQSLSRNCNEHHPSLNWLVTISGHGAEIKTDYMQGIAHVPDRRTLPRTLYFEKLQEQYDRANETGKYPHGALREHRHEHGTRLDIVPGYTLRALPTPTLEEVLYSLVSDSHARLMTFEEWASEYGYDTDSRKAEASYRACADAGIRLTRVVGGTDNLEKLATLFQGF